MSEGRHAAPRRAASSAPGSHRAGRSAAPPPGGARRAGGARVAQRTPSAAPKIAGLAPLALLAVTGSLGAVGAFSDQGPSAAAGPGDATYAPTSSAFETKGAPTDAPVSRGGDRTETPAGDRASDPAADLPSDSPSDPLESPSAPGADPSDPAPSDSETPIFDGIPSDEPTLSPAPTDTPTSPSPTTSPTATPTDDGELSWGEARVQCLAQGISALDVLRLTSCITELLGE